jgi:poly(3-hydroxybutyrate) depolymerase
MHCLLLAFNLLQETYNIDVNQVHITGYSNGGTFTYRMFSYSEKNLAASGSVSGAPFIGRAAVPMPPR